MSSPDPCYVVSDSSMGDSEERTGIVASDEADTGDRADNNAVVNSRILLQVTLEVLMRVHLAVAVAAMPEQAADTLLRLRVLSSERRALALST
ncbi:hypothetical protein CMQ_254 [Grosmannia clavigera kw1407]|uniref:Uncharacterized protein n=1 Tax=Grosmannia clavigera (strain kw1407 / UAMH 11150) TaxID=655863 RepID=F0XRE8_GROCL|nr:uncharacterized protein CMQ_254 [Grosmannia clavigera kw1407]EFW99936.1 hypothetical protein CMQ_254 [Grosmannia clavigera kw1407]